MEFNTPDINNVANLQDAINTGRDFAHRRGDIPKQTDTLGDMPIYILENLDRFGYMLPLDKYPEFNPKEFLRSME